MAAKPLDRRLMGAVHSGNLTSAAKLLELGASPDAAWGFHSALTMAASEGMPEMCTLLIRGGADVDRQVGGYSPLHWACGLGGAAATEALLAAGADSAAASRDDRSTPAHIAAQAGQSEALDRLAAAGAPLSKLDAHGRAPIHVAAERSDPAALSALLRAGVDPNQRDARGDTPLHLATAEAATVLVASNADIHAVDAQGMEPAERATGRAKQAIGEGIYRAFEKAMGPVTPRRPNAPPLKR